jgi:hypothetical protein
MHQERKTINKKNMKIQQLKANHHILKRKMITMLGLPIKATEKNMI